MRNRNRITTAALLALALAGALGCVSSSGTTYVHPAADLGAIRKVAVLPFVTLGQDKTAGAKVERVFLVELLALAWSRSWSPAGEPAVHQRAARAADTLSTADLQRIGQSLGAEGLFVGTVVTSRTSGWAPRPRPR